MITMSVKLKPCPFCGGRAEPREEKDTHHKWFYVRCTECGSRTNRYYWLNFAIKVWNTRTPIPHHDKESDSHD